MEQTALTVLIVEDDPAISEMLQDLLATAGYAVERAADGRAGLARIETDGIDLVLLDVMLPALSGLELCHQVRAAAHAVYLPIIMLTAAVGKADRHAGFAAGADDYVSKPFDVEELLDRVAVWAQTRRRLQAAHAQLLAEYERREQLEQQRHREELAQSEAVLLMAYTPLKLLNNLLHVWEMTAGTPAEAAQVRAELEEAAQSLAGEVERLGAILRRE